MKIINSRQKILGLAIASALIVLLSACSDDKPQSSGTEKSTSASKPVKNHHVDASKGEAADSVKQKFINEFSNKCVSRELKNSNNPDLIKNALKILAAASPSTSPMIYRMSMPRNI
jgi:hypothetical protein